MIEKLSDEEKRTIALLQGFKKLTIAELANYQYQGSILKAKNRLKRLVSLGFVKIKGVNYFEYSGKEIT